MRKAAMFLLVTAIITVVGRGAAAQLGGAPQAPKSGLQLNQCMVIPINDIELPAEEPAPIREILVKEGDEVKQKQLLARLDDDMPKAQKEIAFYKQKAAAEQATNDVNKEYAIVSQQIAKKEWERAKQARERSAQSVSDVEYERMWLQWQKSKLMEEQADLEMSVARHTAASQAAEVKAADLAIQRRQLTSPVDGVVVEVPKRTGEWVAAGEAVLRIIQMDKLWVQGRFNVQQYPPESIRNCDVTFEAVIGDRKVQLPGKVDFIKPEVESFGYSLVRAEIQNRQENGEWVLRPGVQGTLTVHTSYVPSNATAKDANNFADLLR